jgi:hypothetical protein
MERVATTDQIIRLFWAATKLPFVIPNWSALLPNLLQPLLTCAINCCTYSTAKQTVFVISVYVYFIIIPLSQVGFMKGSWQLTTIYS